MSVRLAGLISQHGCSTWRPI